jgi:adenylate cyclase
MAEARIERRLAAILAADVAGYSRLMGIDEEGTLAALKAHRRNLIDPKIAEHRGRIVKTTGDGALVEFASAVDAVRCAMEIQRAMAEHNAVSAGDRRIEFRIGINVGDIIIDEGDIYGDGVNIAARVEALAEPGGICIAENAFRQVEGKLALDVSNMGEQQLKNIARPVQVFQVQLEGTTRPALALPDKPSIAVLPFTNMSGDVDQDYFADGISEDIITALSRFRHLFVIARNSSFTYKDRATDVKQIGRELGVRYILEGSVRKAGNRVRITAQLIDAISGHHVWVERYDRDFADIFSLQDEITERVAGAIEPEVLKIESGRAATRSAASLSAWDLVRQGTWHFHQVTPAGHARARELFRKAITLDAELPDSHIWLARVSAATVAFGWSDRPHDDLREGLQAAHVAIGLDERDPYSHYALAIVSVFSDALEQAARAAEEAVEISPSFALGYFVLGLGRLSSGNAADAIGFIERGLRLNPYDPQNFVWLQLLALAFYFVDQKDKALQTAARALKLRPTWLPTLETLTLCYATLERLEEARGCVKQMRELQKPKGGFFFDLLKIHNPQWAETMATMWRKAGWQE